MLFGRTLGLSVAFLRVSILFDSPHGTYILQTNSCISSFLFSTNLSSIYHYTEYKPHISPGRKYQADSREMWISAFVIAEHNFSENLLSSLSRSTLAHPFVVLFTLFLSAPLLPLSAYRSRSVPRARAPHTNRISTRNEARVGHFIARARTRAFVS